MISCEFNMDTACVELKFDDDTMIAIDTIAVENEIADNMYERSELDWLMVWSFLLKFENKKSRLNFSFSRLNANGLFFFFRGSVFEFGFMWVTLPF